MLGKGVTEMAVSEALKKAQRKYEKTQEKIELCFPEEKKEEYRKKAEAHGMSLSKFIVHLIEEDMKKG